MSGWLDPVRATLDVQASPLTMFFRIDDVGWRTDRLRRLLAVFASTGLPADLAVIPEALTPADAAELRGVAASMSLGLHQHGFAHENHEPEGRKQEFGPSRHPDLQRRDIALGRAVLMNRLGDVLDPVFTPPWNRCTLDTAGCLAELGYAALSRDATASPRQALLPELPVTVDWFAKRKGVRLTREEVGARFAAELSEERPLGMMLHHAVMDDEELHAFLELASLLGTSPAVRPVRMVSLLRTRTLRAG